VNCLFSQAEVKFTRLNSFNFSGLKASLSQDCTLHMNSILGDCMIVLYLIVWDVIHLSRIYAEWSVFAFPPCLMLCSVNRLCWCKSNFPQRFWIFIRRKAQRIGIIYWRPHAFQLALFLCLNPNSIDPPLLAICPDVVVQKA